MFVLQEKWKFKYPTYCNIFLNEQPLHVDVRMYTHVHLLVSFKKKNYTSS